MRRATCDEQLNYIARLIVIAQEDPDYRQRLTWLLAIQEATHDLRKEQRRQEAEKAWRRTFIHAVKILAPAALLGTSLARRLWKEHSAVLTSTAALATVLTVAAIPPGDGLRRREPFHQAPHNPVVTAPPAIGPISPPETVQRPAPAITVTEAPTAPLGNRPTEPEASGIPPDTPAETPTPAATETEQPTNPNPAPTTLPSVNTNPGPPENSRPKAPGQQEKDNGSQGGPGRPTGEDDGEDDDSGEEDDREDIAIGIQLSSSYDLSADLSLCLPRLM